MKPNLRLCLAAVISGLGLFANVCSGQGTAFTYQGQLSNGGIPANGTFDLKLTLFDAGTNGNTVAGPITNSAVPVANGFFTTVLDFGAAFVGESYWLRIQVRTNGGGAFTTLSPRQQLTPAPYAEFATTASNLSGTISATQLPSGLVTNNQSSLTLSGSFAGNGTGLTNVNAAALNGLASGSFWQVGGNTVSTGQYLGSQNNQPLELWAGGQRAIRFEPFSFGAPNVIGGASVNSVSNGVFGATIAGGGVVNFFGSASPNSVQAYFGTVGGGVGNTVSGVGAAVSGGGYSTASGQYAWVGGGYGGTASGQYAAASGGNGNSASGQYAVVSGGNGNSAQGDYSTVGGGNDNTAQGNYDAVAGGSLNTASRLYSFIGGGISNSATGFAATVGSGQNNSANGTNATVAGGGFNAASRFAFVGGGYNNVATDYAAIAGGQNNSAVVGYATVGGGFGNGCSNLYATVAGGSLNQALGLYSTIAGGYGNSANDNSFVGGGYANHAGGTYATVPGGYFNHALGTGSFAAGEFAGANNDNSFVWSDGSGFQDTGPGQFLIQARGGVGIGTNNPHGDALSIGGITRLNDNTIYLRGFPDTKHGLGYFGNGTSLDGAGPDGPVLFGYAGGALVSTETTFIALQWNTGGVTVNGTFNNNSDRNAKENFAPVSADQILEKVSSLPVSEWNYKTDAAARHIGPMAQDFYSAFNVGTDEKHIAPIDEGGVALAAIQGLNQKVEGLKAALDRRDAENAELRQRLSELELLVEHQLRSQQP